MVVPLGVAIGLGLDAAVELGPAQLGDPNRGNVQVHGRRHVVADRGVDAVALEGRVLADVPPDVHQVPRRRLRPGVFSGHGQSREQERHEKQAVQHAEFLQVSVDSTSHHRCRVEWPGCHNRSRPDVRGKSANLPSHAKSPVVPAAADPAGLRPRATL